METQSYLFNSLVNVFEQNLQRGKRSDNQPKADFGYSYYNAELGRHVVRSKHDAIQLDFVWEDGYGSTKA